MRGNFRLFALALLWINLTACGGGGGGGGGGIPVAANPSPGPGDESESPQEPTLTITPTSIKTLRFSWEDVDGETEYRLLEDPDGTSGYSQVTTVAADSESYDHIVFLPGRVNARYILQACSTTCSDSQNVHVADLLPAIGYFKASNTGADDDFGASIALSADGTTMAVGARTEDSSATGVNGDQADDATINSGAVYVFTRDDGAWSQQAYIKPSNTGAWDHFGTEVALSGDGNTLAVGAPREDSNGIGNNPADNSATDSGAVYVFVREAGNWSQQAYIKAFNAQSNDVFGESVALSSDGNTLAVGASLEDSSDAGVDGDHTDNAAENSGAAYVFTRSGSNWSQSAYLKSSNPERFDLFGRTVALSGDGSTLAVGADSEDSSATGVNGDQTDNSADESGAVYVFTHEAGTWSQQAYLKASNPDAYDGFSFALSLSGDGNTLAVGSFGEASSAAGVDGDSTDNLLNNSGAVYVFAREERTWSQQAYIKASNPGELDFFGLSVALSADGNKLAAGALEEDGSARGINGAISDSARYAGAAYLFTRDAGVWSQQAYIKASNTETEDYFGGDVAISADGETLAVSASESSSATGINGDQDDNSARSSGAVYLY